MTELKRIDHIQESKDLMLSRFDDSPKINALLESIIAPLQQLEDDVISFKEGQGITNAKGEMLNIYGSWVGLERLGRSNEPYRTAILGKVITESSDGTIEQVMEAMRGLTGNSLVHEFDYPPATNYITIGGGWRLGIQEELQRMKPMGVKVQLLLSLDLKYMVASELGEINNLLSNENEDTYEVVVDGIKYDLATTTSNGFDSFGATTLMVEDGIDPKGDVYPMADLVSPDYKEVQGFLANQDGDYILDHEGNKIVVVDIEPK